MIDKNKLYKTTISEIVDVVETVAKQVFMKSPEKVWACLGDESTEFHISVYGSYNGKLRTVGRFTIGQVLYALSHSPPKCTDIIMSELEEPQ